jgi:putative flippase GtrA
LEGTRGGKILLDIGIPALYIKLRKLAIAQEQVVSAEEPSMRIPSIHIRRMVKFQVIAWVGTLVNMGTLWLLKGRFGVPLAVAGACAIEAAIIHNFTWHYFVTWRDRVARTVPDYFIRLIKYNAVTASIDFAFNLTLLVILTRYAGLNYLVANVLGMLGGPIFKFLANEFLIFRKKVHIGKSPTDG